MKKKAALQRRLQQGLRHHQAGQLVEAKALYEQALAIDPQDPDALHFLGLIALQSGHAGQAVKLIQSASALQPENWAFQANLASALFEVGELDAALAAFRRAAELNSDEPQLQMGIANCHAMRGELPEAEAQLRKLTQLHPGFALAWFNLANAVRDQGRTEETVDLYRRAIRADPALLDAHNNLGSSLLALGRLEEAEQTFRGALALKPDYVMTHCNLASVLIDRGRFAEAEIACRQALERQPQSAIAHAFMGAAIGHQGRLLEALGFHRKAVALEPDNVRALTALGIGLYEIGKPAEGLPILEHVVSLAPDSWQVHISLATVKLALGDFHEGWREYLFRFARQRFIKLYPDVKLSSTLPHALMGRHVCLLREQGLGDQLFFLRFAAHLKACGARITYRSTPKIASMLGRVPAIDHVIPDTEPIPQADSILLVGDLPAALASMNSSSFTLRTFSKQSRAHPARAFARSLPRAFGVIIPRLSRPLPLAPLADHLSAIKSRLARLGPPPYLGLTWRAGIAPEEQRGMSWMLFKQVSLEQLAGALRNLNGTFLALQRNPVHGEIEQLAAHLRKPVHDLTALNEDLEAMLALLALIDDYVGVSNTNMHLRAGVGRTARVLVPCPAEWRWMASGDESPWFPGFRIYRQKPDGDWNAALAKLNADLLAALGKKTE